MRTTVNGASLNYEISGSSGPWVSLSPGGRRALAAVKPLAQRIAAAGYRVLATGRSDLRLEALGVDFPGIERVVADLASPAECARVVARFWSMSR